MKACRHAERNASSGAVHRSRKSLNSVPRFLPELDTRSHCPMRPRALRGNPNGFGRHPIDRQRAEDRLPAFCTSNITMFCSCVHRPGQRIRHPILADINQSLGSYRVSYQSCIKRHLRRQKARCNPFSPQWPDQRSHTELSASS